MVRTTVLAFVILFATTVTLISPPAVAAAGEITVSAAISLKDALGEIGRLYEAKNKGTKVTFNFGASGDLMNQVGGGAPVDVFASAAQKDMDILEQKGLVFPGSRVDFAVNSLVLVAPAGAEIRSFEDLGKERIKKIAVGDPRIVPAGRYAEEVLRYYKIFDAIRDKFILTANVRQALDYTARAEVNAGIVYCTDAMTRAKQIRIVATAPEQSHKPVVYPIAVLKGTKAKGMAKTFISLVTSAEGIKILEKYGFKAVMR